jgi:hypothetical protein
VCIVPYLCPSLSKACPLSLCTRNPYRIIARCLPVQDSRIILRRPLIGRLSLLRYPISMMLRKMHAPLMLKSRSYTSRSWLLKSADPPSHRTCWHTRKNQRNHSLPPLSKFPASKRPWIGCSTQTYRPKAPRSSQFRQHGPRCHLISSTRSSSTAGGRNKWRTLISRK